MIVIDRNAVRTLELAWLGALLAELGHERAIITREYLHSIIVAIDDHQEASMMVEHQASSVIELAISVATMLAANRKVDSSIIVEKERSLIVRFDRDRHETRQPTTHHQQPTTNNQQPSTRRRSERTAATYHKNSTTLNLSTNLQKEEASIDPFGPSSPGLNDLCHDHHELVRQVSVGAHAKAADSSIVAHRRKSPQQQPRLLSDR